MGKPKKPDIGNSSISTKQQQTWNADESSPEQYHGIISAICMNRRKKRTSANPEDKESGRISKPHQKNRDRQIRRNVILELILSRAKLRNTSNEKPNFLHKLNTNHGQLHNPRDLYCEPSEETEPNNADDQNVNIFDLFCRSIFAAPKKELPVTEDSNDSLLENEENLSLFKSTYLDESESLSQSLLTSCIVTENEGGSGQMDDSESAQGLLTISNSESM